MLSTGRTSIANNLLSIVLRMFLKTILYVLLALMTQINVSNDTWTLAILVILPLRIAEPDVCAFKESFLATKFNALNINC